jgi:hypothetical protein
MIPFKLGPIDWKLPSIATSAVFGIVLNLIFMFFPAKQIDKEFEELPLEKLKLEV